jgi:hypothetical protein
VYFGFGFNAQIAPRRTQRQRLRAKFFSRAAVEENFLTPPLRAC